jgi:hypothetical protein
MHHTFSFKKIVNTNVQAKRYIVKEKCARQTQAHGGKKRNPWRAEMRLVIPAKTSVSNAATMTGQH